MPENSSDDAVLLDEGQNSQFGPAIGAGQRVGLPDLGDEPPPLGRGGRTIRLMAFEQSLRLAPRPSWRERPEPYWGHRRICSKSYSKGPGMIARLDIAVER